LARKVKVVWRYVTDEVGYGKTLIHTVAFCPNCNTRLTEKPKEA